MRVKLFTYAGILCLLLCSINPLIVLFFDNSDPSLSTGIVSSGKLENAHLIPRKTGNMVYFSWFSYYFLGHAFSNDRLKACIMDAYSQCEESCPGITFRLMEIAKRNGGKMLLHKTHQNGLSVDFMTPLSYKGKQFTTLDRIGVSRYALDFDDSGRLLGIRALRIDFETIAKHILAVDDAAKHHGLRIEKVVMKIELLDDLFSTTSGKLLKERGVYFAKSLPPYVNSAHDDHYHVDFSIVN